MIGPLGRLGAAAPLGQHCPQMTQRRCTESYKDFDLKCFHNLKSTVFQDMDRSASVRAAVALQDQMVRSRDGAIQKMLLDLGTI